ncbi:hypothetical protein CMV_016211 [Castanea mollissima]|uniref:Leucine-rich repeat-containing N-terminal plant-type domain-containing protein n=1 Tax=Castanea mollissima TaxID=60419 RepID=A0A8J4R474_9ROSI|nr:hypothetical protein CMV_016211 [Castanea mollissima]
MRGGCHFDHPNGLKLEKEWSPINISPAACLSKPMKLLNPNSLHVILRFTITLLCLQPTTSFISTNEIDRLALLKFKESIDNGPFGSLISWNDSIQFCNWHGITCGRCYQRLSPGERTESQTVPKYNVSRKRATN